MHRIFFLFESKFINRSMLTTNKATLGYVDYVCLRWECGEGGGVTWEDEGGFGVEHPWYVDRGLPVGELFSCAGGMPGFLQYISRGLRCHSMS
jgi:hypothetical protein